jgi:hypothetical protein
MAATPASESRRKIAAQISPSYAANPKVAAILMAGSAARGDADRFSDVEIGVFWNDPPTDEDRRDAIRRASGDLHCLYPYDANEEVWSDDWKIGRNDKNEAFTGISVDMIHLHVESARKMIDAVTKQFDSDPQKQNLIAAIRMGIPLHGHDLITNWRRDTDSYPPELVRAVVQKFGQIDHFWRIEMWRERSDLTGINGQIVATHGAILHTLAAINRVYFFGVKHRNTLVKSLKIAPPDLERRMDECFTEDRIQGEQTLRQLVEEMYDLIEQHVPGVDVQRLRKIFRYRRPLWDTLPPK